MICNQCGANNANEAIFCQKCGKLLATTGQNESTLLSPPPVHPSPYENFSYTVPDTSKPIYPPPPPGIPYESTSTPYQPKPPLRPHSNRRYLIVIAVLVAMLVGVGGFELGQLVKGNQQGNISNMPSPSNQAGTIPANTAQVSTTLTPTLGCPTSGGYFKIVNVNSGLVLEVPNGSLTSAIIQQYQYNGGLGQQWGFVPVGEGYFKIVNLSSDQVLDVPGASHDSKVSIQQYQYNGGLGQQWQCIPVGGGHFKIVNANSGLVLEVPNTSSYALLLQDQDGGGPNQQWQFVSVNTSTLGCPTSGGHFKIVNANSGLVLEVPNTSSYALLLQDQDGGGPNQQWQFVSIGEGYFKIVNVNSGLVLEVPNGSLTSAIIHQYPYNGGLNQQWQCIAVGEGYFKIVNVNSDQVLDVPNATHDSKVSIQQYPYNGGLGQQWRFVSS